MSGEQSSKGAQSVLGTGVCVVGTAFLSIMASYVTESPVGIVATGLIGLGATAMGHETVGKAVKGGWDAAQRAKFRNDLVSQCNAIANPPGSDPEQIGRISTQRKLITDLPYVPDAHQLQDGEKMVASLQQLMQTITGEVSKRRKNARAELVKRCKDISNPDGVNENQLSRIDAKRTQITELPEEPDERQLQNGESVVASLPELMQTITGEVGKRRKDARADLVQRCNNIGNPGGADPDQLSRIDAERALISKLPEEPDETQLQDGEKMVSGLQQLMQTITGEVSKRRKNARAELVKRCKGLSNPDGVNENQLSRINAKRAQITELPEEPDERQLQDGESVVASLPELMQTITGEVSKRRKDARADLVQRCNNISNPGGADPDQLSRIDAERAQISTLPEEPDETQLQDGEKVVSGLQQLMQTITGEVSKRRKDARAELIQRCNNISNPAGINAGQLRRIDDVREQITQLPEEPDETQLNSGQAALAGLPGLMATITNEVDVAREALRQRWQAELGDQVRRIKDAAIAAVGGYEVYKNGERKGCVKNGPQYDIENKYAAEVQNIFRRQAEGEQVRVGNVNLTFHYVAKGGNNFDVTLHRKYMQPNPETKAILHVVKQT
jgi:hypothetical protein